MASRIIVKNLPPHASDGRLREFFAGAGEVTDCRVQKTKDGRSRGFAFIGFRTEADAQAAVKQLNRSFFDTSKISVEVAHAPGSDALARPWSKYAAGSSAYEKREARKANKKETGKGDAAAEALAKAKGKEKTEKKALGRKPRVNIKGTKVVRAANVKPTKAGVSDVRTHMEFESSDEENGSKPEPRSEPKKESVAFNEELDDLAYLKMKAKTSQSIDTPDPVADAASPKKRAKGKKRSKLKGKNQEAVADDTAAAAADGAGEAGADAVDAAAAADAAAEPDVQPEGMEDLESTGRLYITNLPYGASEEDLRAHFEPLGEVESVVVCKDEDTLKSRGFGYVTYVFPECAVRAVAELDLKSFQGRLLRLAPARQKPEKPATEAAKGNTSSYKRKLEERKKKVDAHLEHTWNLLYVSANAAADAAAAQLGVSKSELFGKDAENAAVTAALTETSIIQQTKSWLLREGIRVDAFEQKGSALTNSKAIIPEGAGRREDTLIVKHLPAAASSAELRERFGRFGDLVRCSLAPSGTVGIVQYTDKGAATRAFQKLAFSRYRHVPLYLEWAPEDVFTNGGAAPEAAETAAAVEEEGEANEESRGHLFVKNLSFQTTDEGLKKAFRRCKGLKAAVVMRKKAAEKKGAKKEEDGKGLSMGYGFLEFETAAQAADVLKSKQGVLIDGHAVQLQVSRRGASKRAGPGRKASAQGIKSSSICVRNVAFEATRKELYQLFGAYGTVTSCRLPKKSDYSGHRGFAFLDFASRAEAQSAFEALQHSHLYGRRLVIEPAEEKATDVANVQMAAAKRQQSQVRASEAKKRRKAGVLNAPGEAGSFEDALMS
ncbi:unnamed protein product [Effrenium voratum]|nr:unnamed protein product [Effrenium voratum]